MANEKIKKKLGQYRQALRNEQRLRRKIELIETRLTHITVDYAKERVKGSAPRDMLAETVDELNALKKEAIRETVAAAKAMRKVSNMIEQLDDAIYKDILQGRYIEGKSWEQISLDVGLGWRQTHNKHAEALRKLQEIQRLH